MRMSEQFEKGLKVRKAVLGEEYVEKSLKSANHFTQAMQQLTTEWCWGEVWTREGLDRKTRSIINLSMLTALNRPHEIRVHVRGAINNGLSTDEIKEIFLQTAIYCGVPAAMDSFRIANEVFVELGLV
jgi:4-carboxymuconolactone decarboxylase